MGNLKQLEQVNVDDRLVIEKAFAQYPYLQTIFEDGHERDCFTIIREMVRQQKLK